MLALRKTGPRPGVELAEVVEPAPPEAGEVVIEVASAGICGSDLHIDHWTSAYGHMIAVLPVTLGHEFAGGVVALGSGVSGLRLGDRVTVMPGVTCGVCEHCLAGDPFLCASRKSIGLVLNGGFSRLVSVPARNCLKLPDEIDEQLGALSEPMAVAANTVLTADIKPGGRVLIFGPGTIGQGIALFCDRAGASEITVVGMGDGARLDVLRQVGFDDLIDLAEPGGAEALRVRQERGYDRVIEAVGARAAFDAGFAALSTEGILTTVGIHPGPLELDIIRLVRKRLQVRGAFAADPETWHDVVAALAAEPARFAKLITHRLPLARALEGFAIAHSRQSSKVMLAPGRA